MDAFASCHSNASLVLSQLPACIYNSIDKLQQHGPFLKNIVPLFSNALCEQLFIDQVIFVSSFGFLNNVWYLFLILFLGTPPKINSFSFYHFLDSSNFPDFLVYFATLTQGCASIELQISACTVQKAYE